METLIKCRWVCNKCKAKGRWSTYKELLEKTVLKLARRHMQRAGHNCILLDVYMELEAKRQYRSSSPTISTPFTRIVSHSIVNDCHLVQGFEKLEEG